MADSHGESTSAHTEADGGHGGGFPPFESSTFASQLVSLVIAFVALYLIVSRIALPRVESVIDARQNAIEGDLAAAQKLKDESDAALKAYESELAAARSRAQAIGNETREKLNATSEAERKTLEARIFGGSLPTVTFGNEGDRLGDRNVQVATQFLSTNDIRLVQLEVGGTRGRTLVFHTDDGKSWSEQR